MVHVWDRNNVPCNQYIGSLGPGTVILHGSVGNRESNGTSLVSKRNNNRLFSRFRNIEAIFSKDYHICMGINLTGTKGNDTSSVINPSLWIFESSPSNNPIQIFSTLLITRISRRNNRIWSSRGNRWWDAWEVSIDSSSNICNSS